MSNNYPGDAAGRSHIGPPISILPAFRRFLVPFLIALVLLLVGALVFHNFLLGDKVLLYKDVGADSINDSYPYFVLQMPLPPRPVGMPRRLASTPTDWRKLSRDWIWPIATAVRSRSQRSLT